MSSNGPEESIMNRIWTTLYVSLASLTVAFAAFAGSSRPPPGGDQGSAGSEPALLALLLFSLVPGVIFVRKALAAQKLTDDDTL